jgi:hypothetical protein
VLTVDMAQVSAGVRGGLTQNEKVEVIGHYASGDQQKVVARWIQQQRAGKATSQAPAAAPAAAAAPSKVDEKAWQRIHGKVESVQGTTLQLKRDDGQVVTVDMSKVAAGVRKALTAGEGVTVIGHFDNDKKHINAQFIQQDSSAGAASPKTNKK